MTAATEALLQRAGEARLQSATAYLKLAGDVIGGWVLAEHALAATGDTAWAESKATMFNLYADELLSLSPGLAAAIIDPAAQLASSHRACRPSSKYAPNDARFQFASH